MRTYLKPALAILLLASSISVLGACHTVQGAGQDISATGNAVDNTAKKATP